MSKRSDSKLEGIRQRVVVELEADRLVQSLPELTARERAPRTKQRRPCSRREASVALWPAGGLPLPTRRSVRKGAGARR